MTMTQKLKVAFAVTNCICFDQRVMKVASTVERLNCEITIIGRTYDNCCNSNLVPFTTRRFRMIFRRGFLFYMFFNIRLFLFLLFRRFHIVVSNDLDTLLPSYLISKIKHNRLVYDSHEYFTGVPELQNRPFVKWIWKSIERSIFPHLDYIMTVSDSIADQYWQEYLKKPITVRNCSLKSSDTTRYSRSELGVDPEHLLLILQGTGINRERGGEELVDAMSGITGVMLLIIGSGDNLNIISSRISALRLNDRIKIISRLPWAELMRYTRSADAGLSLDKNSNMNYSFSLPNKVFEYIVSGIPVIASDLIEIRKIITKFRCGLLIENVRPETIREAILKLRDNRKLLAELKQNSSVAAESLNWEEESLKVVKLYKEVINSR